MGKLQSIESNGNSRTESPQSIQNSEELEVSSIDSGFIETKRDKKNRDLIVATSKQRKTVMKYNKQMPFLATVIRNEELVKSSDSEEYSVRMIIFASGGMKYIPGDHLFVFPENPQEIVNSLILRCGLQFNDPDLDRKRSHPSSSEQTLTLRETMTQKVDLVRPLRQNTLELLVEYASSDVDKKGLLHISQDLKRYTDWMKEMPTVIDALDQFPSVDIPLEELLQVRMQILFDQSRNEPPQKLIPLLTLRFSCDNLICSVVVVHIKSHRPLKHGHGSLGGRPNAQISNRQRGLLYFCGGLFPSEYLYFDFCFCT